MGFAFSALPQPSRPRQLTPAVPTATRYPRPRHWARNATLGTSLGPGKAQDCQPSQHQRRRSADSGRRRPPARPKAATVPTRGEKVAAFRRIPWPPCHGITGRLASDSVAGFGRICSLAELRLKLAALAAEDEEAVALMVARAEGVPDARLARMLGVTPEAVRMRALRLRRRLQGRLDRLRKGDPRA